MPFGNSLTPWEWDEQRIKAATLLAEDRLTIDEIAAEVGVHRQSLWHWRKFPDFAHRIEELRKEMGEIAARHAITKKNRRLASMTRRWEKLHQIIEERSTASEMQSVPGGTTGLLVRQLKMIGSGENSQVVEEYTLDAALLREIRELEKRAVEEVGPEHIGNGENADDTAIFGDLESRRKALVELCFAVLQRAGRPLPGEDSAGGRLALPPSRLVEDAGAGA